MSKSGLSLTGNSNATVEDLSIQINALKSDISALTQTIADLGAAKTNEAKHAVAKTASQLQSASQEKLLEAQLQAEDFVQKQPAASLGVAAGLGFIIGLITARR